jgi:hypothetical protein
MMRRNRVVWDWKNWYLYGTGTQPSPALIPQLPKQHPPVKPNLRRRGWRR